MRSIAAVICAAVKTTSRFSAFDSPACSLLSFYDLHAVLDENASAARAQGSFDSLEGHVPQADFFLQDRAQPAPRGASRPIVELAGDDRGAARHGLVEPRELPAQRPEGRSDGVAAVGGILVRRIAHVGQNARGKLGVELTSCDFQQRPDEIDLGA
jgi:hypothetical protein